MISLASSKRCPRGRPPTGLMKAYVETKFAVEKAIKWVKDLPERMTPIPENPTLYGLLRLRFNDDANAPKKIFPELAGCALIRELHVYGQVVAARENKEEEAK